MSSALLELNNIAMHVLKCYADVKQVCWTWSPSDV